MKIKKKTVYRSFSPWHIDSFAQFLDDMARKGWHFREWSVGLVFEKGEPMDTHYAVEIFSQASGEALRPEPKTQEFAEYCQAAGWRLCDAKGKMCIFKQLRPDAVPILTDEERLESIQATMPTGKLDIFNQLFHLLLVMFAVSFTFRSLLFNPGLQVMIGAYFLQILAFAIRQLQFRRQSARCQKQLAQGLPLRFLRTSPLPVLNAGESLTMVALWMLAGYFWVPILKWGSVLLVAVLGFILYCIAKRRPDPATVGMIWLITFVFILVGTLVAGIITFTMEEMHPPQPPLTLEQLESDAGEPDSCEPYQTRTLFGTHESWDLTYGEEITLSYDLYESQYDWVLDAVWADDLKQKSNAQRTDCADAWQADAAYRNEADKYRVRYEGVILYISLGRELTQEQIAIIRDCLGLR